MMLLSVVATWGFSPGGVERHVRSLDDVAAELGFQHRIIAAWAQPSWAGDVESVADGALPVVWSRQLWDGASLLRQRLQQEPADVLLLHGFAPLLATLGGSRPRIAVNYYPGGLERRINWDSAKPRNRLDRVQEETLDAVERALLRNTSAVVVLNEHGQELLRGRWPQTTSIVVPPHVCSSVALASHRPIDLLLVRRIAPRMGHAELLQQIAPLIRAHGLRVVIVGTGPLLPQLRNQISNQLGLDEWVECVGSVDSGALIDLYQSSRFVMVPARGGEGFGLTALEALAAGALPMVSDVPALRGLVQPVSAQLIARHDNWYATVKACLVDKSLDEDTLVMASAKRRAAHFSLTRTAEKWHSVLGGARLGT